MSIQPYKIKHIPTGYYYQPITKGGSNLGKTGKIYTTAVNGITKNNLYNQDFVCLSIKYNSPIYKKLIELGYEDKSNLYGVIRYFYISQSEFEKEDFHC